jgi:hypothetical protein
MGRQAFLRPPLGLRQLGKPAIGLGACLRNLLAQLRQSGGVAPLVLRHLPDRLGQRRQGLLDPTHADGEPPVRPRQLFQFLQEDAPAQLLPPVGVAIQDAQQIFKILYRKGHRSPAQTAGMVPGPGFCPSASLLMLSHVREPFKKRGRRITR